MMSAMTGNVPTPPRTGVEDDTIDHLRRTNDALQTFVRTLSHDLRRPLTAAKGYAELLDQRGDQLSARQRKQLLRRLQAATDEMDRMIQELLDTDRASVETLVHSEQVDVAELLREIAERHRMTTAWPFPDDDANNGATSHQVSAPDGSLLATIDQAIVRHIVDNLLHNAVVHTPPATPIKVDAHLDAGELRITVADDGPGIPLEHRSQIFEPYVSFDQDAASAQPSGKPSKRSRGIGLALVERLAALHGGSVELADTERGATFVVTLPLAQ